MWRVEVDPARCSGTRYAVRGMRYAGAGAGAGARFLSGVRPRSRARHAARPCARRTATGVRDRTIRLAAASSV